MEDITGKKLGPYQVIEPLGEGGMAAVYKGYQPGIDRYVALKVLPRRLAEDPQFVGRFQQEAKILAQLQHPHILPIFDYGESEGYTYIAMPFIPSGTLGDLLTGNPIPLTQTTSIISQIADALDYAHKKGLLHRDIKPSNVLIDDSGNCLLADFGIAKILSSTSSLTNTGGVIGTPDYMSPEQGQGQKLDERSDVYSLGVVLYEMVTGRVPFRAETPVATVMKHIHDPLPSPRMFNNSLPETVEQVLLRALAKDPSNRFPTAGDLAAALQSASTLSTHTEIPVIVTTVAAEEDLKTEDRANKKWLLLLAAISMLLLLCAGGYYFVNTRGPDTSGETPGNMSPGGIQTDQPTISVNAASTATGISSNETAITNLHTATAILSSTVTPTTASTITADSTTTNPPLPTPQPEITTEVIVDATIPRTETGLRVLPGQRLIIEYLSGSWRAGPSAAWQLVGPDGDAQVPYKATFPVHDRPIMALVGGVGASIPAAFGNRLEFISKADGNLWLGPNDDSATDNAGQLVVRVTISDAESLITEIVTPTSSTSTPFLDPNRPATDPAMGSIWKRPRDNMNMVFVPAGSFYMGSGEGDAVERPVHEVSLDGFWIDQTEVTNSQYAEFLNDWGNQIEMGSPWIDMDIVEVKIENESGVFVAQQTFSDHPVIGISWYGASAYCDWVGGQLPTEAQWEFAARGPENRQYPWGEESPTCELAQFRQCRGQSIPVGSFAESASWVGTLNMAGNVWEWVNDWYVGSYYVDSPIDNPQGPEIGESKVLRGGSWKYDTFSLRSAYRTGNSPAHSSANKGFRCAIPGR